MLTVLFSTRNRASILEQSLDSFLRLQSPPGGWKLVAVDNGSSDGTPAILSRYVDRLPLTTLVEPRPGKNVALNSGLTCAEGDLLVFTDDDGIPCADWLIQYRRACEDNPAVDIFGGPVRLRTPGPLPSWLADDSDLLGVVYGATDPTLQDGPIENPTKVSGLNFAIRASLLSQGRRFDESIGPNGGSYAMGSETELLQRLLRAGHRARWVQGAPVEHIVRPEQLADDWILGRATRQGRGMYRRDWYAKSVNPPLLFGRPRWAVREMIEALPRLVWLKCFGDRKSYLRARWDFNLLHGRLIEGTLLAKEGSSTRGG